MKKNGGREMADVIRLNRPVLAENYQNDLGASIREWVRSFVSSFSADWEKARAKEAHLCEVKSKALAYVMCNGQKPVF